MQIRCVMQLWFFPMLFHLTRKIRGYIHLAIGRIKREKKRQRNMENRKGIVLKKGKPHIDAAASFK